VEERVGREIARPALARESRRTVDAAGPVAKRRAAAGPRASSDSGCVAGRGVTHVPSMRSRGVSDHLLTHGRPRDIADAHAVIGGGGGRSGRRPAPARCSSGRRGSCARGRASCDSEGRVARQRRAGSRPARDAARLTGLLRCGLRAALDIARCAAHPAVARPELDAWLIRLSAKAAPPSSAGHSATLIGMTLR